MKLTKIGESLYLGLVENQNELTKSKLKYQLSWKLTGNDVVTEVTKDPKPGSYVLMNSKPEVSESLYSVIDKINYQIVLDLLERGYNTSAEKVINWIGDSKLIDSYNKPGNYVTELLKELVENPDTDSDYIDPKDDNRYLFDLFKYITDNGSLVSFGEYNRISQRSEVALMSKEDKDRLIEAANSGSKSKLDKIYKEIDDRQVKMFYNSPLIKCGPLVYNKEYCNVSVRSRRKVTLNLPKNEFGLISVQSQVLREYNLIQNGRVKNQYLNIYFTDEVEFIKFKSMFKNFMCKSPSMYVEDGVNYHMVSLDLNKFLILKSGTVKPITYSALAKILYRIDELGYLIYEWNKTHKKSKPSDEREGTPVYEYLKSLGIEGHGGDYIPPHTVNIPSGKVLKVTNFVTKLSKLTSKPDRDKVMEKVDKGVKLTPKETMVFNTTPIKSQEEFERLEDEKKSLNQQLAELKVKLVLTKQNFIDDGTTEYLGTELTVAFEDKELSI